MDSCRKERSLPTQSSTLDCGPSLLERQRSANTPYPQRSLTIAALKKSAVCPEPGLAAGTAAEYIHAMPKVPYHRLPEVLSGSTQSELRRLIQYLKAENEVLRACIDGLVQVFQSLRNE